MLLWSAHHNRPRLRGVSRGARGLRAGQDGSLPGGGPAGERVDYAPSVSAPSSSPGPEHGAAPSRRILLLGTLTLGGLGGSALLTGCDLSEVVGRREPSGDTSSLDTDPDGPLLVRIVADVGEVAALGEATVVAHPALGPTLDGLRQAHADHAAVLQDLVDRSPAAASPEPTSPEPTSPATTPGADADAGRVPAALDRAWARVRQAEAEHAAVLLSAARTASSGTLARVLAAAGAGVSTHLATLPQGDARTVSP